MSLYGVTYPQLQQANTLTGTEIVAIMQNGLLKRTDTQTLADLGIGGLVVGNIYAPGVPPSYIPLFTYADYAGSLVSLNGLRCTGTLTVTAQINGVNIPGLTNLAVTSTPQNALATSGNSFVVGDRVILTFTGTGTLFESTIAIQR